MILLRRIELHSPKSKIRDATLGTPVAFRPRPICLPRRELEAGFTKAKRPGRCLDRQGVLKIAREGCK